MSDPANTQLLVQMSQDLGEIKGLLTGLDQRLTAHATEDQQAHARIAVLELKSASQQGRASVWSIVAVGVGSMVGYVVQIVLAYFRSHQ